MDRYLSSVVGNESFDGNTAATAKALHASALAGLTAGDTLYVDKNHVEMASTGQAISLVGTAASPVRIVCVDFGTTPPTNAATGGKLTTSGSSNIHISGHAYVYGMEYTAGSDGGVANFNINNLAAGATQKFERCTLAIKTLSGSTTMTIGSQGGRTVQRVEMEHCKFAFANPLHRVNFNGVLKVVGGGFLPGSATPGMGVFSMDQRGGTLDVSGFDFSALAPSVALGRFLESCGTMTFSNCKLPGGWLGNLSSSDLTAAGQRIVMQNCDAGDVHYSLMIRDFSGEIKADAAVFRNAGAPQSRSMQTNANAKFPHLGLRSSPIVRDYPAALYQEQLGSPITVSVEIVHEEATNLTASDVWLELEYQGTDGSTLSLQASNRTANILGASTAQPASTEAWTTAGIASPRRQVLSVTVTPREAGRLMATVVLARPNTILRYCPKMKVA